MRNRKKQIYKTDHPIIKEIAKGDKFMTECGEIITLDFAFYNSNIGCYDVFIFHIANTNNQIKFPKNLIWTALHPYTNFSIKYRYFSLKDKIDLL